MTQATNNRRIPAQDYCLQGQSYCCVFNYLLCWHPIGFDHSVNNDCSAPKDHKESIPARLTQAKLNIAWVNDFKSQKLRSDFRDERLSACLGFQFCDGSHPKKARTIPISKATTRLFLSKWHGDKSYPLCYCWRSSLRGVVVCPSVRSCSTSWAAVHMGTGWHLRCWE